MPLEPTLWQRLLVVAECASNTSLDAVDMRLCTLGLATTKRSVALGDTLLHLTERGSEEVLQEIQRDATLALAERLTRAGWFSSRPEAWTNPRTAKDHTLEQALAAHEQLLHSLADKLSPAKAHIAKWKQRMAEAGGTHIRDCIFELNGSYYNLYAANPAALPDIIKHQFHTVTTQEAFGEPLYYVYMHPESGCAWLQDFEQDHAGDGCVELVGEVPASKAPKSQAEFLAFARSHKIQFAHELEYKPELVRKDSLPST